MTGVKVSWMSPFFTSLPVVTRPQVLSVKGLSERMGSGPAIASASRSFSSSMTRGIIRIPASFAPFFTAVFECRVAIISSSRPLRAFRRVMST